MNPQNTSFLARRASRLACLALAAALAAAPMKAPGAVVITETFTPGLNVPDVGFIADTRGLTLGMSAIFQASVLLDIGVRGAGGFNGELIATLQHGGQQAVLLNQTGRATDTLAGIFGYADAGGFRVTLDDAAAHDIHTYQNQVTPVTGSPLTGTWQPDGRLETDATGGLGVDTATPRNARLNLFNGLAPSGDWTLVVTDTGFGDTLHRLNSWGLQVTGSPNANPTVLHEGASITATGVPETFHGLVTVGGKTTFNAGPDLTFAGGLVLASSSELQVEGLVRVTGNLGEGGAPAGLIKTGAGTLRLEGLATHTDRTIVRAGTLEVAGELTSSRVTVEAGGVLTGAGTLGLVDLAGGRLAPGHNTGTMTSGDQIWSGGSSLLWEINSAGGTAGSATGWDLLRIDGGLAIQAITGNKFGIILRTLTSGDATGLLYDFDPDKPYNWTLAETTAGITGFATDVFALDTSGFANVHGGSFSLILDGDSLGLFYTPVPEPAEVTLAAGCLLAGFSLVRRKFNRQLTE